MFVLGSRFSVANCRWLNFMLDPASCSILAMVALPLTNWLASMVLLLSVCASLIPTMLDAGMLTVLIVPTLVMLRAFIVTFEPTLTSPLPFADSDRFPLVVFGTSESLVMAPLLMVPKPAASDPLDTAPVNIGIKFLENLAQSIWARLVGLYFGDTICF